ncbi:DUF4919 domain-containing protein [Flavobacterium selenitireducens]|uniref:DUF4919 domain-containing protein n=1 Tax=Flavobacterium selenitireducens TaxID=2722704 RepID=UPI00168B91E8|nr:DUF4919 domain-containing protein [Flavobacterium selenitireducens]MBD3582812.1 DUF4919 domain-containing protein [Flavobacterium selenitireducens]
MKKIFLFLFTLSALAVLAQEAPEKPDYARIETAISDPSSDYHYPKLMQKFQKGDTTMTLGQKRHLYYGFRYQKRYNPYGIPKQMEELRPILQKKPLSDADALKVVSLGKAVLADNPFDLRMMNVMLYASEQIKDITLFHTTLGQMKITVDALMSSGDGKSTATAFYVTSVGDEYQLLNILGYQPAGKQSLVDGHYDFLEVTENPDKIKGLYFDVSASMDFMEKQFGK